MELITWQLDAAVLFPPAYAQELPGTGEATEKKVFWLPEASSLVGDETERHKKTTD